MRIKKIQLQNFKRFADLTISAIPETSKLVLLIGSNGSGKSSVFDAFDWLGMGVKPRQWAEETYYRKVEGKNPKAVIQFYDSAVIHRDGHSFVQGQGLTKKFIGRSAIRIEPRMAGVSINPTQIALDQDSPASYIEHDRRFGNDVFAFNELLTQATLRPVFAGQQSDTLKIFQNFIEPFNDSLRSIFGSNSDTVIQVVSVTGLGPSTPMKLVFKKGNSEINYDLLSHGEKQVVILLINFIVRKESYENSIIFIDEMDCHLNAALQFNLLAEIVSRWIPDSSQFWTASHALGFIDYARKSENASIIDFDALNFDYAQEIQPAPKDELDVYEIAMPKEVIKNVLRGYRLVVVENKNDEFFNLAFGDDIFGDDSGRFLFLPARDSMEVFLTIKQDESKLGIRDRDYLRNDEIEMIKAKLPNLKILNFYNFENCIYHPKNIAELGLSGFAQEAYELEITKQKNEKIHEICGEIGTARHSYQELKEFTTRESRENIQPIIDALKSDVFDVFYPFFNMKKHFKKSYLASLNLRTGDLVKTNWFKAEIKKILTQKL